MDTDDSKFVTLIKFVTFLNEWQSTKRSSQSVQYNGLVVTARITLECNHGGDGKEVFALLFEKIVKGDIVPWLLHQILGKGSIKGVRVGQAPEPNSYHGAGTGLLHFADDCTEKECIPVRIVF